VTTQPIAVSVEATAKKAFATAVDWPGWSRSGKTEELALAALREYAPRYAVVAEEAGIPFDPGDCEIVERTEGAGGTNFGVPSSITDLDRRPVDAAEAKRQARLVEAAWTVFARVAADAPAELRKGPRGGGRDRDKMVGHVAESDTYYAREVGIIGNGRTRRTVRRRGPRGEMLDILRHPRMHLPWRWMWTARYGSARLARPRPRLGDGGPVRPCLREQLAAPVAIDRPTLSVEILRPPSMAGVSINPTAAAASPMSPWRFVP
jgi:hypothetical protein